MSAENAVTDTPTAPPTTPHDPYLWLEEVEGREAMTWVQGRNAETAATIEATNEFAATEQAIREVLDSDDKIPDVSRIGEHYYNFWRDAQHERGVWRRTTLDSYRTDHPAWELVLDLDALGEAEDQTQLWSSASPSASRSSTSSHAGWSVR